jgi:hypothetical protein
MSTTLMLSTARWWGRPAWKKFPQERDAAMNTVDPWHTKSLFSWAAASVGQGSQLGF